MGSKRSNDPGSVNGTVPRPQLCPCSQHLQEWMDSFPKMVREMARELFSEFAQGLGITIEATVQKAVEKAVNNSCTRSVPHDAKPSVARSLKLNFMGTLPDELITWDNIKAEGASLMVELLDSSGLRVEDGTESSVKIKILVLNGDFEVEDRDDWRAEEFDKYVAQPRKDKAPLLRGKCEIAMKNGFAMLDGIAFTDNSKSMRNGKFRLGARVVRGLPEGVEVRDAVSRAFQVKERRVKFYRKHKKLSLEDSPECLKHIGKTLAQKLAGKNIRTVQDFLQLYNTEEQVLKDILHLPDNKWSELIIEAKSCPVPQEVYKHSDNASDVELVLDCVFNIKAVVLNGKITKPYAALNDCQKELVDRIRLNAYHEKRKKLQEYHTQILMTPKQDDSGFMSATLHPSGQHQGIPPPRQHELGTKSSIPHPSEHHQGPPSQAHQELHEKPNQPQEFHTPVHDEFRPSSSIPQPSTSQHPDATAPDTARTPVKVLTVDRKIGKKKGVQEICSTPPNQTCQGEEGSPHPNSPGYKAEVGHTIPNYNQMHQTMPTSSEAQLLVDQNQDLFSLCESFHAPPNADFFRGVDAYFDDMLRLITGGINTHDQLRSADVPLPDISPQSNVEAFDSSYCQVQDSNQTFDSSPTCSSLKRPRFG